MEKEWNASLKELRSLPVFWAYVFGIALIAFTSAVIIHIPSAVVDAGYTMEKAASISSLYLLIAVPGKMILGYILTDSAFVRASFSEERYSFFPCYPFLSYSSRRYCI